MSVTPTVDAIRPATGRRAVSFDIAALAEPAGMFTGDLYFAERRGEHLWFGLGDVAGKGLDAAIFTRMFLERLDEQLSSDEPTVGCLVECLHDLLAPEMPSNRFVSLAAGSVAPDGALSLVNAGHTEPIIIRAGGGIETVPSTGPVVGILPNARWCARGLELEPGDSLLLYSDGVTEALDARGSELGRGGLEEILRTVRSKSARELVNGIRQGVAAHRGPLRAHDDLTILAIRAD